MSGVSPRHHWGTCNVSGANTNFVLFTCQHDLSRVFPLLVKVNFIFPSVQDENIGIIFDAFLALTVISNPSAHLESVYCV